MLEALKDRDIFLSLASHELKTPLTAMRLQAGFLKDSALNQDAQVCSFDGCLDVANSFERQVERLVRLVNDMLDISRIRTGRLPLRPEYLDICEVVRDCVATAVPQFVGANSSAPTFLNRGSIFIHVDPLRIGQVINNILTNSLKYGRNRPVVVEVSQPDQSWVEIRIADQGIGISDQDMPKIFDRFFRGVSDNEESGLGLGLYIAKEIVEAHKGAISADSAAGAGSRFTVRLPTVGKTI